MYGQHLNLVLGDAEETVISVDINEATGEELINVCDTQCLQSTVYRLFLKIEIVLDHQEKVADAVRPRRRHHSDLAAHAHLKTAPNANKLPVIQQYTNLFTIRYRKQLACWRGCEFKSAMTLTLRIVRRAVRRRRRCTDRRDRCLQYVHFSMRL